MAETYDSILFICPKVAVYQVPPLTGKGFKTDSWGPLAQPIFSGRLRVIQTFSTADTSSTCEIRIEDPQTGELFAAAPYIGEHAVERAQDSTRYYQVRVVHEKRVAYLGLGFEERETSFDFQVALADYLKHARAGKELLRKSEPVKDYSLKDGQSINISLGHGPRKDLVNDAPPRSDSPATIPFLAPPPKAPSTRTRVAMSEPEAEDDFGDFQ